MGDSVPIKVHRKFVSTNGPAKTINEKEKQLELDNGTF